MNNYTEVSITKKKLSVELSPPHAELFKDWLRENSIHYSSHECYNNILIIGYYTEAEELRANEFLKLHCLDM